MTTVPANRIDDKTPVYLRIQQSPSVVIFREILLVSRTFTGTLKDLTLDDEMIVRDVETGEDVKLERHKKVPQLVLAGTVKRASFLEIDDESKKMKEASDKIAAIAAQQAENAAEMKAAKEVAAKVRRTTQPGSTSGMSKVEKIIHRAKSSAKRLNTLEEDMKKTDEKLKNYTEELVSSGYTVTVENGDLKVLKADGTEVEITPAASENKAASPEADSDDGKAPATAKSSDYDHASDSVTQAAVGIATTV